jgi:hypothetical protein
MWVQRMDDSLLAQLQATLNVIPAYSGHGATFLFTLPRT